MTETTIQANDFDARQAARIFRDHRAGVVKDTSTGSRGWKVHSVPGWEARESGMKYYGDDVKILRVFAPNGVMYNCGLPATFVAAELRADEVQQQEHPTRMVRAAWPQPDHSVVLSVEYVH